MNKYLSGAIVFIAGFGAGFGVSYILQKQKFEQKLNEEALKNQDYYIKLAGYSASEWQPDREVAKTLSKNDDEAEKSEEKQPEEEKDQRKFDFTEEMNRRKEVLKRRERIAYDKIPPNYEDNEAENEVNELEMMINNDDPTGDIKIISSDMFFHDYMGYEDETLLWWEQNHILSTEDYDILDIPDLIGTEWQNRIGEFEPNAVYVVNHTARTKYEIVRQSDDYYDYKD